MKIRELIQELEMLDGDKEVGRIYDMDDSIVDITIGKNEYKEFQHERFDYFIY